MQVQYMNPGWCKEQILMDVRANPDAGLVQAKLPEDIKLMTAMRSYILSPCCLLE